MKNKKIISAMLIMTLIATTCNTNAFAAGKGAAVVTDNQGNNDSTSQTSTTFPYGTDVNGSVNNIINQMQAPVSAKSSTDEKEGYLIIGKEIENKSITDIVSIPKNEIKSVIIEDGVTFTSEDAFKDCTNLTSITIPNSVTKIGNYTFMGCTGLTSVTIPDKVTHIGNSAFFGCTSLISITIPNSVTKIGNYTFMGCTGLTSVTIPDRATHIGDGAFWGCTGLTSITIPNDVTSIGSSTFQGCTELKEVTIGNSTASIDWTVFLGCTGLTSINVDKENKYYKSIDGILFSKDGIKLIQYPAGKIKTNYTVPDSVTNIGASAFKGCTGLTSVTIPDKATHIGVSAFEGCTGLTSVTIPDKVTHIGVSAFEGCTGLTSVNIPDSVTSIGVSAFEGCTGLTSVNIPDGVTKIDSNAFIGCTGLTSINVDEKNKYYKSIDDVLFSKDGTKLVQYPIGKKATNYIIPDSVTKIDWFAFSGCIGLTSINVDEENKYYKSIDGILFSKDGTKLIQYPAGKLETNYTIPDSVTCIGTYAFKCCASLTSVTIGNDVKSIDSNAFSDCTGLTSINIDEGNSKYKSIEGVLFSKDGTKLIQYPIGKKAINYIIPDSVTKIDWFAFSGCTELTSIVIPDGVSKIKDGAFSGCTGLKEVTIPQKCTIVYEYSLWINSFDKNTTVHRK